MNMKHKLLIKPIPKPRMTQRDKWSKRKCVTSYWEYKDLLQDILGDSQEFNNYINEIKGDGVLKNLTFCFTMPNSWSKSKKIKMLGSAHQNKPDLDNLIKAFIDCLFEQDNFIYKIDNVKKVWGDDNYIEFEV